MAGPLLKDRALYKASGRTAAERETSYRAPFATPLANEFVDALPAATSGGWLLGASDLRRELRRRSIVAWRRCRLAKTETGKKGR